MTHPIELLSVYLDGEATLAERRTIEQHLERCAACRARLADYRVMGRAQRDATPPVPADLAAVIRARVDAAAAAAPRAAPVRRSSRVRPWTLAAAAGLIIALFAGVLAYRSPQAPRTVSDVAASRAPEPAAPQGRPVNEAAERAPGRAAAELGSPPPAAAPPARSVDARGNSERLAAAPDKAIPGAVEQRWAREPAVTTPPMQRAKDEAAQATRVIGLDTEAPEKAQAHAPVGATPGAKAVAAPVTTADKPVAKAGAEPVTTAEKTVAQAGAAPVAKARAAQAAPPPAAPEAPVERAESAAGAAGGDRAEAREAAPRPGSGPADAGTAAGSLTLATGEAERKAVRQPATRPAADLRIALDLRGAPPTRAEPGPAPDGSFTVHWQVADPARARSDLVEQVEQLGGGVTPDGDLFIPAERAAALFEWLAARGVTGLPTLDEFGPREPLVRIRLEP